MAIYISLFLLNVIGVCFPSKYQRHILPFWILLIFIFIGFRYEIGGDWPNYIGIHQEIKLLSFDEALKFTDIGYAALNYFSPEGLDGMIFVNAVCAAIFCGGLYSFCKTLKYPMFAMLIALPYLIFAFSMIYTRQSAAMGFVLMALPQLTQNKIKKFFIITLFGCTFHFSAIIIIIFYLYKYIKKSFLQLIFLFIIILIIGGYFFYKILSNRIEFYSGKEMESAGATIRLFINLIASFLFFIKNKKIKLVSPYYDIIICMIPLNIILLLISFKFSTMADRIGLYIIPLQLIIFPLFPSFYKLQLRSLIIGTIILSYFTILLIWLLYSPAVQEYWIPYKNYLFL